MKRTINLLLLLGLLLSSGIIIAQDDETEETPPVIDMIAYTVNPADRTLDSDIYIINADGTR